MADVLNRTTKEFLRSVHTPAYPADQWIRNPDLSAVSGLPTKYWKISGDTVLAMDAAEQAAVDAAEDATRTAEETAAAKAEFDAQRLFRAVVGVMLDQINVLRQRAGLAEITPAQARTAIMNKLDGGV